MKLDDLDINEEIRQDILAITLNFEEEKYKFENFNGSINDAKIMEKHPNHPIYYLDFNSYQHEREMVKIDLPMVYTEADGDDESEGDGTEIGIFQKNGIAFTARISYGEYTDNDNDASAELKLYFCNDNKFLEDFINKEIKVLKEEKLERLNNQLASILYNGYQKDPEFLSGFLSKSKLPEFLLDIKKIKDVLQNKAVKELVSETKAKAKKKIK